MPPFVRFHDLRHPTTLGEADVKAFLVHLAEDRHLAPSTLAQALAALMFLYKEVLGQPIAGLGAMPRARAPLRLPVVLTPEEVRDVLGQLRGTTRLIGILLYGSGMRLMECLTLRIKDLDPERGEIRIRRGKGAKDRVTVLPAILRTAGGAVAPVAVGVSGASEVCGFRDGPAVPTSFARVGGAARDDERRATERYYEAGDLSYASTFVCDSPSGERCGHPDGAGVTWPP